MSVVRYETRSHLVAIDRVSAVYDKCSGLINMVIQLGMVFY